MLMYQRDPKLLRFKILPINPYYSKILVLTSLQVHCFDRPGGGGYPLASRNPGMSVLQWRAVDSCEREAVSIDFTLEGLRMPIAELRSAEQVRAPAPTWPGHGTGA
jgi:hypothetical protein